MSLYTAGFNKYGGNALLSVTYESHKLDGEEKIELIEELRRRWQDAEGELIDAKVKAGPTRRSCV